MTHTEYMRKYNATEKGAVYNRSHVRAWKKANPEHARKLARDYMRRKRAKLAAAGKLSDHYRAADLKRHFGLSLAQYDAMLESQNGKCKLCGNICNSGRRLAVDHDHVTGHIRGLLCGACNLAINRVETVPEWASKAQEYLGVN